MNRSIRAMLCTGAVSTGLSVTSAAYAAAAPSDLSNSDQLEEIIVTAQRRVESLQRTPVAVTAYSTEDLAQLNVRTARDLIQTTPNLQAATPIASDSGATVFVIRGLSEARGGTGAQPAVGIYIDDVYYPSLHGSMLRILDLSSVEVLRGPQGTLFGRNTIGGAIRYNTLAPTQQLEGHVEATGGSFNHRDVSGAVNVPLTDTLAVRLTAGSLNQDGFVNDELNGQKEGSERDLVGRIQVRYVPTEHLTIDVVAEYDSEKFEGESYIVNAVFPFEGLGGAYNAGFLTSPPGGPPQPPALQLNQSYVSQCRYCQPGTGSRDYSYTWANDVRATIAWEVNDYVTIKSLSAYFNDRNTNAIDLDRTALPIIQNVKGIANETTYSQELQAAGAAFDSRFNWLAGLYYYDYDDNEPRYSGIGGGPPQPALNTMKTKSYAAYSQLSFAIIDPLTVSVGGRASREEEASAQTNLPLFAGASSTFNDFSPMGKLQYQWTPDIMTYVSAEKAFRGGGNNVQTGLPPEVGQQPFAAEKVWSYEVGVRSQLLDRHLQLNATAFRMNYDDIQLLHPFPPSPGSPVIPTVVENAGKAVVKGVEFEARALAGPVQVHATLSTLHARYTELAAAGGVPPQGVTLSTRFQHAPDFTYSLGGVYEQPLPLGKLLFNLDWSYQAEQTSTGTDIDSQVLPSYSLLNGRLNYEYNSHWNFSVAVTNILNKYYFIGGANVGPTLGASYLEPGSPRQYAGTLQYRF